MVLKRTAPEVLSSDIGPVRMWRDDVAELVSILGQCCDHLSLTADDYELDEVPEDFDALLRQGVKEIEQLTVVGDNGRVRLQLGVTNAIAITAPTLVDKGALIGVYAVIRRCRRLGFRSSFRALLGASLASALALIPLSVLGVGMAKASWDVSTVIYTSTRAQAPTFWERKRDDIWINAVSLVAGGLIGYFVNELTG